MNPITCIIVDDEPLAVKLLESFVDKTPQLKLERSFTDSVEALAWLREHPVQLAFMDIQMPDMNGMELSHIVAGDTKIIFTTAFKEYAFESYEVNALDFLLKPVRYNKFLASVEKARKALDMSQATAQSTPQHPNTIFIRVDGEWRNIPIEQIVYVNGMKDYVLFCLDNLPRPLVTHLTMKAVEDMLPKDRFLRVHRSYIVAVDKIRKVDRNDCIYIGDEVIHVPDGYMQAFRQFLESRAIERK